MDYVCKCIGQLPRKDKELEEINKKTVETHSYSDYRKTLDSLHFVRSDCGPAFQTAYSADKKKCYTKIYTNTTPQIQKHIGRFL